MIQKNFQNPALYWVGLFVNLHNDLLIQIIFFLTLTKKNGLDFSLARQSSEYPQIRDLEKWTIFFKNGKESVQKSMF